MKWLAVVMGKISKEDNVIIKHCSMKRLELMARDNEFPQKVWSRARLDRLIQKKDAHGKTDSHTGSGRPKSIGTTDNIAIV